MGDFNMELNNLMFKSFLDCNNLTNLIKNNTYFKDNRSSVHLILTNRKHSFKYTSPYETGLSGHYHLIYAMLKSSFINIEPKLLDHGEYKKFSFGNFKEGVSEVLLDCRNTCDKFEMAFIAALDKHAAKKKKVA